MLDVIVDVVIGVISIFIPIVSALFVLIYIPADVCSVLCWVVTMIPLCIFAALCNFFVMRLVCVGDYGTHKSWAAWRVWVRSALFAKETYVTDELLRSVATRPPLPAHFVVTLPSSGVPRPAAFRHAQLCAFEAALRLADNVTVWVSGTQRAVDEGAWSTWRRQLDSFTNANATASKRLGHLRVVLHAFLPTTTVGAYVHRRTGAAAFDVDLWGKSELPTGDLRLVTNLARADILERPPGGIYIDNDVVAMDAALFRLPDGAAMQVASRTFATRGLLHEALNQAIIISAAPSAPLAAADAAHGARLRVNATLGFRLRLAIPPAASSIAQAYGQAIVRHLEAWDPVSTWAKGHPFGPRAVTDAWASGAFPGLLYHPSVFGYETCGHVRLHKPPKPVEGNVSGLAGGRSLATSRRSSRVVWRCEYYSQSRLPIDWDGVTDAEYAAYRLDRVAQHGVKWLPKLPKHTRDKAAVPLTIRQRLVRDQCRATAAHRSSVATA